MMKDRFGSPYDAVLHLLDRQVLDRDGLMVGKVDDLELSGDPLRATALLIGAAGLMPRFGPRALDFWQRLGDERADRSAPYRVGLDRVAEVTSAVRLQAGRHAVLRRSDPALRLSALLALRVRTTDGTRVGRILDVRIDHEHRVAGLVVGPGRPGSLLGYDRNADQGPAAVRWVVGRLHRRAAYVAWEHVPDDLARGALVVDTGDLEPLTRVSD